MTEQNIIDFVIEKLNEYPKLKYNKKSDTELEIYCLEENGFDIMLELGEIENTLYLGSSDWQYDNTEDQINEMLQLIVLGLTGVARLKVFSRNSEPYKWILQVQDIEGNWFDNGTFRILNFNFWTKSEIKYLQNNLLPKNILFPYNETE